VAGVCDQHFQDSKGFFLQPKPHSAFAEFARLQIDLEIAETNDRVRILGFTHGSRDLPGLDPRLPDAPFRFRLISRHKSFALKVLDADGDLFFC
jgi:hypothetical protein